MLHHANRWDVKKTSGKAKKMGPQSVLITGGAGFIGVNVARYFLDQGTSVIIFDNLSRKGADVNLALLEKDFGKKFDFVKGDVITDFKQLRQLVEKADAVIHLAAQVAVTTSVADPRTDFEINAIGSFNIVEAIRLSKKRPALIYSSTNKVYGSLHHRPIKEHDTHYRFEHDELHNHGVSEVEQLDFHSPYGCSKGIADQYVIDYSRVYGLKTVVFRQSCVYGPFQFGVEDQGWVAWFAIAALLKKPITIYGNGKQVRDLLYIDDLAELYDAALKNIDAVSGNAYNIGGGPANTLSLIHLLNILEKRLGRKIPISSAPIRVGDQPIFVADVRKIGKHIGWKPKHDVTAGFEKMMDWIEKHQKLIAKTLNNRAEICRAQMREL
jgi:CDP-paratose 2-epimerase